MPKLRIVLYFFIWFELLFYPGSTSANSPTNESWLFNETGHTLSYNFRLYWQENGGLEIFGFPITEVFLEKGKPVQYFERSRLEWQADKGLVLGGLLGRWQANRAVQNPAFKAVSGASRGDQFFFKETSHTLGGSFQNYWQTHGGLPVFGFPISEEFNELNPLDGKTYLVQYFERARFEYHNELASSGQPVLLGQLGRTYLDTERPAPDWALQKVTDPDKAWERLRPVNIKIARLGLDSAIVEGGFSLENWDVPRYTAVHYWPVSAFPGSLGNIVIAGHAGYKNIIFDQLPLVKTGDQVVLDLVYSQRTYQVTQINVSAPDDESKLLPTPDETLTLITCVPPGLYTQRLVITAKPLALQP